MLLPPVLHSINHQLCMLDIISAHVGHCHCAVFLMQVLPSLLEVCPEARLNLAVHYLRQGQLQEAFRLVEDLQPATPQEYTLKGQHPVAQPNST